jgi:hypothetical protein
MLKTALESGSAGVALQDLTLGLVVSRGAEVRIHGSVHGYVRNRGRVDVYGQVREGEIVDENGGESKVHTGERLDS